MLYTERKEIKSPKGKEYKINERKAIGIFKEKYIKIMLINVLYKQDFCGHFSKKL